MQTPDNTERYMVTKRGGTFALRFNELRVFDYLCDAVDYAKSINSSGYGHGARIFLASNTKRAREIKDWE